MNAGSLRQNGYRLFGTRSAFPLLPGTAVPGFHMPPLRGWKSLTSIQPLR
jgi:hypothetical protein